MTPKATVPAPGGSQPPPSDLSDLPFVAPCRRLSPFAPLRWLRLGYRDFRRAWPQSLSYGVFMAVTMALVSAGTWVFGSYWLMFAMLGGFIFLAPLTCTGLYVLSAQLERGQAPSLRRALRGGMRRYLGNEMVFALVLMVIFLVWIRAGAMLSVFLPMSGKPQFGELTGYLAVGSAVGAVFAAVTFSASAFSLPMIVHRRVDAITAVVTSVNAVLRNKLALAIWMALIIVGVLAGVATAFVGLAVILPIIGHAAWHGYQETIDADAFPRHQAGVTAEPRSRTNQT